MMLKGHFNDYETFKKAQKLIVTSLEEYEFVLELQKLDEKNGNRDIDHVNDRIKLQVVQQKDLDIIFKIQQDTEANNMAAFTAKDPNDRVAFNAHWNKIQVDQTVISKVILYKEQVVGNLGRFELFKQPHISYWIDKEYWGKGIATKALDLFLQEIEERPLFARVAKDNQGSIRVLEKCGFVITGEDKGFSQARNQEVEEYIFRLES